MKVVHIDVHQCPAIKLRIENVGLLFLFEQLVARRILGKIVLYHFDLARIRQMLLYSLVVGRMHIRNGFHEHDTIFFCQGKQRFRFFLCRTERLFEQDMLSGFKSLFCLLIMQTVRTGDIYHIHFFILEHGIEIPEVRLRAMRFRKLLCPFFGS